MASSTTARTIIPSTITHACDVIAYVEGEQRASNALIQMFDYTGDHRAIIPLVDLWFGMRVDLNPLIAGGTIIINGAVYVLGLVIETDGFHYWRAGVEPGQFNMYNITSVVLNPTYLSPPTQNINITYGLVQKGACEIKPRTYTYAFNKIYVNDGPYLGISHTLNGCDTILYANGNLFVDSTTKGQFDGRTYNISYAEYYKYADEYYDFIYGNGKRTPLFNSALDTQKSRGITYEIYKNTFERTYFVSKTLDGAHLTCTISIIKMYDALLGISASKNPKIINVQIKIDGALYPCTLMPENWYDEANIKRADSFWRLTKQPLIFPFMRETLIEFRITFATNSSPRDPIILTYGTFRSAEKVTHIPSSQIYLTCATHSAMYDADKFVVADGASVGNIRIEDLRAFSRANNIFDYLQ